MIDEASNAATGPRVVRIMTVDDSLTYRTLLRQVIQAVPGVELVAQSSNGRLALPLIREHRPDILLLDQEMPEMDGLSTLREVREQFPDVGVVMFSAHTIQGAKITMQALELGALDFATKPGTGSLESAVAFIRDQLIPDIIRLAAGPRAASDAYAPRPPSPSAIAPQRRPRPTHRIRAVGIGISTGGPQALMQLLPGLPAELGLPVFIVQHMPPLFTKQLAATLDAKSQIRVVEGEHAAPVEAGTAYIAPGGRHMIPVAATDQSVSLHVLDTPAERNARPSVDVLFRGMAAAYGGACAAAIMTGMGDDGYEGMLKLREAGAFLMAQDKDSCLIFGMPARPVREGLIDAVLDINGIARCIGDLVPEGLAR